MLRVIAIVAGLVSALVLICLGLATPVGLRTVHPALLTEAGRDTPTVAEMAEIFLDGNLVGPAKLFAELLPEESIKRTQIEATIGELEQRFPQYRRFGGPDPYMEAFVDSGVSFPSDDSRVMYLLAGSGVRRELTSVLSASPNRLVESILNTRTMTPLQRFLPIETGGGAPFEAAILTTALLAQANYLNVALVRDLQGIASRAVDGEMREVNSMEIFLLGVVSASKRTNWRQLTQWVAVCDSTEDLARTGALARGNPDAFPLLYAAIIMSEDPAAVADYMDKHGAERGWQDLGAAVNAGTGAVSFLVGRGEPLFHPHLVRRGLDRALRSIGFGDPAVSLAGWALAHPTAAIIIRLLLFFIGGFVLAMTFQGIVPAGGRETSRRWDLFSVLRYLGSAAIVMLLAMWFAEPQMFSKYAEQTSELSIEFTIANPAEILQEKAMPEPTLDQVTLLVLLIFFLVQFVIYVVCLIKVTQIRRQSVSPELKLKLIDNEDNLFDTGLYVGLSGTLTALIMLAMGIIQASLIGAYSSTLFGILFVAVLRICHVRPLRRRLLIESDKWAGR